MRELVLAVLGALDVPAVGPDSVALPESQAAKALEHSRLYSTTVLALADTGVALVVLVGDVVAAVVRTLRRDDQAGWAAEELHFVASTSGRGLLLVLRPRRTCCRRLESVLGAPEVESAILEGLGGNGREPC